MDETWKAIPGFPFYEASNQGRIRSLKTGTGTGAKAGSNPSRLMKTASHPRGYQIITMYTEGKRKCYYAHRLIASAFIDEIAGKLQINHINGIKSDNRISNLEIVTQAQNIKHRSESLGIKKKPKATVRKLDPEKAAQIREKRAAGMTMSKLASQYGVSEATISYIISGKLWKP